jgi:3',5'-cyclic AMP phosphodiesterase CpdA
MSRSTLALTFAAGICSTIGLVQPALATTEPVIGTSGFRVLPYLMSPTASSVKINWFTSFATASSLEVSGPGLASPLMLTGAGALLTELDYFQAEKALSPRPADMWPDNSAFKHSYDVTGLLPASTYTYTATVNGRSFTGTFTTAPATGASRSVRLAVVSDSETLVSGRTRFREWSRSTPQLAGSTGRPAGTGRGRDQYFISETTGYQNTIATMDARNPDLVVMPGDLIEGTAGNEAMRRWDEFFRHNAGEYDDLLTKRALVAAIGNNCIFAGTTSGSVAPISTNERIQRARQQWSGFFDFPSNGTPAHQDLYFRQDWGKVTIITLCSVKASEEANHMVAPTQGLSPLTQSAIRDTNRAWFSTLYTFGDMPDFNEGTTQWNWAAQQLAEARAAGQIIFVQWHHVPWSRGVHGSNVTSNQSGEAMRIYQPLMEQFRVAGVLCGHSEVNERSFVDLDNDGYGVNIWDVGFAGDGLRGVEDAPGFVNSAITNWRNNPANPQGQSWRANPYSAWVADQNEAELWQGNTLVRGGKHYGFMEINVEPMHDEAANTWRVEFQGYVNFPVLAGDSNFTVTGYSLRRLSDRVVLIGTPDNLRPSACSLADLGAQGGAIGGDGVLDNNDFAGFIELFFGLDLRADIGSQGGALGSDGSFDNNDFAAFVTLFFTGCP